MTTPTADPASQEPNGAPRRWRRRLLIVSILLNVFLIGAIGAGIAARHGPHLFDGEHIRPHRPFEMLSPRRIRAVLPDSARPIADALFDTHRDEMRGRIDALFEARRAVAAAIRAEPFDGEVLDAALAELRSREAETAAAAQAVVAELVGRLDAESRGNVAALLDVRRDGSHAR